VIAKTELIASACWEASLLVTSFISRVFSSFTCIQQRCQVHELKTLILGWKHTNLMNSFFSICVGASNGFW
jgi:hypothetical protein